MTRSKLMEMIYDKLANNYEYKCEYFEPSMVEDMVFAESKDGTPVIAMVRDGVEYSLSLSCADRPSDWKVFEPTSFDLSNGNCKGDK